MAKVQMRTTGDATSYEPVPADIYVMRIRESKAEKSQFKDDKTGEDQWQLRLTWEISRLTAEQQEAEVDVSRWVRQWLNLYYGETKRGPSKMKAFIDSLASQGLLEEFDPDNPEIDEDWFLGIEQRVTLNVNGQYNNVVMVSPLLRAPKKGAKPAEAAAPAKRNAPQHIAQAAPVRPARSAPVAEDDEDDLFDDPPF